jgi:hypothetical protein
MTPEETGKLLATCASFDRRKTGPLDVIAWNRALGDLRYQDCEDAVIAHYTEDTEWIMPAHVRRRVRTIRAHRIEDAEVPAPPSELADNPPAYSAALHAARVAIADGADPRPAIDLVARRARRELGAS